MQAKTMEGLIGAGMNMKMMDVPIRVYKEARRKDDFATMERAMGYAGDFAQKADDYKTLADEGMKEEKIEAGKKSENETGTNENQETDAHISSDSMVRIDTVEISEEGRKLLMKNQNGKESAEE